MFDCTPSIYLKATYNIVFELTISTAGHSELHTAVRNISISVLGNLSALFINVNSAVQIGEGLLGHVLTKPVGGSLNI